MMLSHLFPIHRNIPHLPFYLRHQAQDEKPLFSAWVHARPWCHSYYQLRRAGTWASGRWWWCWWLNLWWVNKWNRKRRQIGLHFTVLPIMMSINLTVMMIVKLIENNEQRPNNNNNDPTITITITWQDVRMDPTKFAKQGICYKGFVCKVVFKYFTLNCSNVLLTALTTTSLKKEWTFVFLGPAGCANHGLLWGDRKLHWASSQHALWACLHLVRYHHHHQIKITIIRSQSPSSSAL